MHRSTVAKVLLLNEKGEILVLRRSEYKEHPEKSHQPDFPGGMVDPGESERHAAVREVLEETGISLDPNSITIGNAKTYFYSEEPAASITRLLYVAHLNNTPSVTLSYEHEAYDWHDKATALDVYQFGEFYSEGLQYLLDKQLL